MDDQTIRRLMRRAADELPTSDTDRVQRIKRAIAVSSKRPQQRAWRWQIMVNACALLFVLLLFFGLRFTQAPDTGDEWHRDYHVHAPMPLITSPYPDPIGRMLVIWPVESP